MLCYALNFIASENFVERYDCRSNFSRKMPTALINEKYNYYVW